MIMEPYHIAPPRYTDKDRLTVKHERIGFSYQSQVRRQSVTNCRARTTNLGAHLAPSKFISVSTHLVDVVTFLDGIPSPHCISSTLTVCHDVTQ